MNLIIKPKKTSSKLIVLSFVGVAIIISFIFKSKSSISDVSTEVVNLALKKNGQVYLYSILGFDAVEGSIAKNESPIAMAFMWMYKYEDSYFVEPEQMKELVAVMSGNYNIHDFKEKSYEGYVTEGSETSYVLNSTVESTETIGQQNFKYDLELKNQNGKTMHVRWMINQKTWEKTALSNCEFNSFNKEKKPSSSQSVYTNEANLVVNIADIAKFFGKTYSYDSEALILYIEE